MKQDMVFIFLLAVAVQLSTVLLQGSADADSNKTTSNETFFLDKLPSNDFEKTLIGFNHLFVDKTMFIAELINLQKECDLISRPSRWGKTFNMLTTACFFDIPHFDDGSVDEYKRNMTKSLFVGGSTIAIRKPEMEPTLIKTKPLKISKVESAMREMGRHPTILLTFSEFGNTFDEFIQEFAGQISRIISSKHYDSFLAKHCERSGFLRECHELLSSTKEQLAGNLYLLKHSIEILIALLTSHFNSKTVVLIDEYDVPLNRMICDDADFSQTVNFLEGLFTRTFRGNTHANIYSGVVTGILQFSRARLSTGLAVCAFSSVLHDRYRAHFGFTETEVQTLLEKNAGYPLEMAELKTWYDGYVFGQYRMYNPLSIRASFESNQTDSYWIESVPFGLNVKHENSPLRRPFMADEYQRCIQKLFVSGLLANLRSDIEYTDAATPTDTDDFLSALTSMGYTTACQPTSGAHYYNVWIPNEEVRDTFKELLLLWTKKHTKNYFDDMDRVKVLGKILNSFMQKNVTLIEENLSTLQSAINETTDTKYHCDVIFALLVTFCDAWDVQRSFDDVISIAEKLQFHCHIAVSLKPTRHHPDPITAHIMVNGNATALHEKCVVRRLLNKVVKLGVKKSFKTAIQLWIDTKVAHATTSGCDWVQFVLIYVGRKLWGMFNCTNSATKIIK
ncbi:uncharacterized protein LOC135840171 isoform X2 [Planococcus citri]